jgi:RsiW-degrading membrane proteinase PrsW (M82 family)
MFGISCWNSALQQKLRQSKAEGTRFDALTAGMMKEICKLNAVLKVIVMVRRFKHVL